MSNMIDPNVANKELYDIKTSNQNENPIVPAKINPNEPTKELCDVVISCYGLNPVLSARLIYESSMSQQKKEYWKPEKLELLHDMKNHFRMQERRAA